MFVELGQRPVFAPIEADLAAANLPGVEDIFLHDDLRIAESDKRFGNTDPRFTADLFDLRLRRSLLAARASCRSLVVMVPQMSDGFFDLDQQEMITSSKDGYKNWPSKIQPKQAVTYDPARPPYMIDLPTDGLITATPHRGVMLNTADCAAVAIYEPDVAVLAVAHIGRAGAERHIGVKMIEHMCREYGALPKRMLVYFGAAVAPEHHVLSELRGVLASEDWQDFRYEAPGGYAIDFTGYAARCLVGAGVSADNFSWSNIDVFSSHDHFSYEEHKLTGSPNGRNGFVAAMA